ncbi:hypothetical protein M5K25_023294 [Dendrobium thyrsiflorum]|uniref:Uncharacterized protein n=1 Tax=Dendrobium thyrsiflorum TaxID=117978 RepID=A0ABD0U7M4_DENTH
MVAMLNGQLLKSFGCRRVGVGSALFIELGLWRVVSAIKKMLESLRENVTYAILPPSFLQRQWATITVLPFLNGTEQSIN